MRLILLAALLSVMIPTAAPAQSPMDGNADTTTYQNTYFHFLYSWPKFLQPYNVSSLALPHGTSQAMEFMLFSARQGNEPYGIVMMAEKRNVRTQHTNGIANSAAFIDLVQRFPPELHVVIQQRKHFKNADGLVFDELDYTESGGPSSAIATEIGEFLIVFKCNAKSAADLAEMNKSAAAMRLRQ
jgi:hypothetical protein